MLAFLDGLRYIEQKRQLLVTMKLQLKNTNRIKMWVILQEILLTRKLLFHLQRSNLIWIGMSFERLEQVPLNIQRLCTQNIDVIWGNINIYL